MLSKIASLFVEFALQGQEKVQAALHAVTADAEKFAAVASKVGGSLGAQFTAASDVLGQTLAGKLRPALAAVNQGMVDQIARAKGYSDAQAESLRRVLALHGGLTQLQQRLGVQPTGLGQALGGLLKQLDAGKAIGAGQLDKLWDALSGKAKKDQAAAALASVQQQMGQLAPVAQRLGGALGLQAAAAAQALQQALDTKLRPAVANNTADVLRQVAAVRGYSDSQALALRRVVDLHAALGQLQQRLGLSPTGLGAGLAKMLADVDKGVGPSLAKVRQLWDQMAGQAQADAARQRLAALQAQMGQLEPAAKRLGGALGAQFSGAGQALQAALDAKLKPTIAGVSAEALKEAAALGGMSVAQAKALQGVVGLNAGLAGVQQRLGLTTTGLGSYFAAATKSITATAAWSPALAAAQSGALKFGGGLMVVEGLLGKMREGMEKWFRVSLVALGAVGGPLAGLVKGGIGASIQGEMMRLQFERLSLTIAGLFRPEIAYVTNALARLANAIQNLSPAMKEKIVNWTKAGLAALGVAVILPRVIGLIGVLIGGIRALAMAVATGLASTGIGALLPLIGLIVQAMTVWFVGTEKGRGALYRLWEAVKPLVSAIGQLFEALGELASPLMDAFADLLEGLMPILTAIVNGIAWVVGKIAAGVRWLIDTVKEAIYGEEELQRQAEEKAAKEKEADEKDKRKRGMLERPGRGFEDVEATYKRIAEASVKVGFGGGDDVKDIKGMLQGALAGGAAGALHVRVDNPEDIRNVGK